MKYGYVRVSSQGQNTARQDVLMQELGVDAVYTDKLSGKTADYPQLCAMSFIFIVSVNNRFCARPKI